MNEGLLLKKVSIIIPEEPAFPFSLPWLKTSHEFDFTAPVTLFIGENGSGKSTLIELIATKLGIYRISFENDYQTDEFKLFKAAASQVRLTYGLTKPAGFFFRAEDFTKYIDYLTKEKIVARAELSRIEGEYKNKSEYAKTQAATPHKRALAEIDTMYQKDLTEQSHGESYLDFFASRMRKNQIYLLDEPETPLSIQNQLALLVLIKDAVAEGCQFLIATHSPVLMAYPGAVIHQIQPEKVEIVTYDHIESVTLLKQFLQHPDQFLRHL